MAIVVHPCPPIVNAAAQNSGRSLTGADKFVIGKNMTALLSAYATPINAKLLKNRVIRTRIPSVSLTMPLTADLNK